MFASKTEDPPCEPAIPRQGWDRTQGTPASAPEQMFTAALFIHRGSQLDPHAGLFAEAVKLEGEKMLFAKENEITELCSILCDLNGL